MKKKDFVKSYLTVTGLTTLWLLVIIGFFRVNITENIFLLLFTLFSNVITSITTYYFARKNLEKESDKNE